MIPTKPYVYKHTCIALIIAGFIVGAVTVSLLLYHTAPAFKLWKQTKEALFECQFDLPRNRKCSYTILVKPNE